jgi:chitin disaccharide deacetylase
MKRATASAATETLLIVNADDFGHSAGVNRGVTETHEHGIVTSASLMVDEPAAEAAAAYARGRPELSLGLHAVVRRWRSRLPRPARRYGERRLQQDVAKELRRQLDRYRSLVRENPTHIDSHQHRHRSAQLRPVFLELAHELGVPLREFDERIRFCGDFYGQLGAAQPNPTAVEPSALIALLEELPPGITELCSHPGYAADLKRSSYRVERALEVATLCHPTVRAAIENLGIELISFRDLEVAA